MSYINQPNLNELYNIQYIAGDNPTTCPICGNRTEILLDMYWTKAKTQVHECLTKGCNVFVMVAEE